MPKMKTSSGAKKRFRFTATGKINRHKGFRSHILSSKTRKRKRQLRKSTLVSPEETKRISQVLHS